MKPITEANYKQSCDALSDRDSRKGALYFIASTLRKDPREDLLVRIASLAALLDTTIFILQLTSRPSPFLPVGNQAIDSPCVNVMGPSLTLSLLSPEASLATFCFLS